MLSTPRGTAPRPAVVAEIVAELCGQRPARIRRMSDWSTYVYEAYVGGKRLYVRVLPEVGDSLEPEALVHHALLDLGVSVPRALAVVSVDDRVGLSVMVTSAVSGRAWRPRETPDAVLAEAGRQLARMHRLPVDGAGWITRTHGIDAIRGDYRDHADWMERELGPLCVAALASRLLDADLRAGIEGGLARSAAWLAGDPVLVHGDMGPEHVFQSRGRFTGFIDFGEIRGAPPEYDLATFMRFGAPEKMLALLRGYGAFDPAIVDAWIVVQNTTFMGRRVANAREIAPVHLDFMRAAIRHGLDGWTQRICV